MKNRVIFDIEIFRNYLLIAFKDLATGRVQTFEQYDDHPLNVAVLRGVIARNELIGFNCISFDLTILSMALAGKTTEQLKEAADDLIVNDRRPWEVLATWGLRAADVDLVDLIEVAPGIASLKVYGGRLGCPKLQDLPFSPAATIFEADREVVRQYCVNDLDTTLELYRALEKQIDLRRVMSVEYGQDLRSKSDAQIAEAVIKSQVAAIIGETPKRATVMRHKTVPFTRPDFIRFQTPLMQDVAARIDAMQFMTDGDGKLVMPDELAAMSITIGGTVYALGLGGIHSQEKTIAHATDDNYILLDRDVASYYPNIILNQRLYPKQLTAAFVDVYRSIVARRLAAKAARDTVTDGALKITINGSFGKFGSPWSALYSPDLLIQTTITGQLALLMLIEDIELHGISVVSANTDGIVIRCPRAKVGELHAVCAAWEFFTGFTMEETPYSALFSRDVNNYIAVKPDGTVKTKGAYAGTSLMKSPAGEISIRAALDFITDGTPVHNTIRGCNDITKFATVRTVRGGAVWSGQHLGKTVRFYFSTDGAEIRYQSNGNKVPLSDSSRPLMDIPVAFPADVDFDRYIAAAHRILSDIGATA